MVSFRLNRFQFHSECNPYGIDEASYIYVSIFKIALRIIRLKISLLRCHFKSLGYTVRRNKWKLLHFNAVSITWHFSSCYSSLPLSLSPPSLFLLFCPFSALLSSHWAFHYGYTFILAELCGLATVLSALLSFKCSLFISFIRCSFANVPKKLKTEMTVGFLYWFYGWCWHMSHVWCFTD